MKRERSIGKCCGLHFLPNAAILIKTDESDGRCSTHEGIEKSGNVGKNLMVRVYFRYLIPDFMIVLKWI
jgi:hypothetical protein